MPDTLNALFAFLVAALLTVVLVPPVAKLAGRIGAIDHPRERGLHDTPTPRLGGLAMLAGFMVAALLFLPVGAETAGIVLGALAIAAVGFLDDTLELGPGVKLAGQLAAATIPVLGGVRVDVATLPFLGSIDFGWIAYPATVIGIVAVINVVNFIDGVDGLAAGVGTIAALSFVVIALSLDRTEAGVLAAATGGAALGFLRHGFPPASSFMGDTGSHLLGFLLAMVAVQGALKTNAVVALVLPLLVLAVPILDSTFVIAKRMKYRRPIYGADSWHFHHRMANIGFSPRRTLAYLYGWTLSLALVAIALRFVPYSDDRGNFDPGWTAVMVSLGIGALAASVYVVVVLEILKLRRLRGRQLGRMGRGRGAAVDETAIDEGVARELETGQFATIDPDSGELRALPADEPLRRER